MSVRLICDRRIAARVKVYNMIYVYNKRKFTTW